MEIVFWAAAALLIYVYAGYPLLLALIRALVGTRRIAIADHTPPLTLVISAYNEAEIIGEKIRNSLSLDYPQDRLEVLVVSDCSSDGTDEIVSAITDPRVRLLRMADRGGKTLGLNAAAREARGEIIVFSDANAMYLPNALRMLARNFADARIGAVIGESTYSEAVGGADADESLYWRYEVMIKRLESALGSTVGGDGAIYAIRKALYRPMRADALSDFVNPLQIVQAGERCIYEPEARSVEKAAGDFDREFRRKVRIVNRAWRAMMSLKTLLNPFRFGFFSFEIFSHKLLRWLVPLFLVVCLVSNALLLTSGPIYIAACIAQLALYGCALLGHLFRKRDLPRLIAIPYYFVMVNLASARGIIEAYRGKTYTTWTTARASQQ
jgi:cellulose synthase/poly-beta-1,6-N-acetylglucosamine synthase-like glycosyltransferase